MFAIAVCSAFLILFASSLASSNVEAHVPGWTNQWHSAPYYPLGGWIQYYNGNVITFFNWKAVAQTGGFPGGGHAWDLHSVRGDAWNRQSCGGYVFAAETDGWAPAGALFKSLPEIMSS